MPYANWKHKPSFFLGEGEWHLIDPDGEIGAFGRTMPDRPDPHQVEIHEDGSISVSPSLVMPGGWHGWLRHGELTTA